MTTYDLQAPVGLSGTAAGVGELLAPLGKQHRQLDLVVRLMEQGRAMAREVDDLRELEARSAETERDLSCAVEERSRLHARISDLQAPLQQVAIALGGCPYCIGVDPTCSRCQGNGQPGFVPPHQKAFERWLVPALRAYAYCHARDQEQTAR